MGLRVRASAPGRCGIVGNPSDIYGGHVLSCSLPARASCELVLGEGMELPEDRRLWDATMARLPLDEEVRVIWTTDVPRSSGLAGSTALLAATVACVLASRDERDRAARSPVLAELVRDIERNGAGIMCGYQDAYMAVHGGLQLMDFSGKHPEKPGPPAELTPLSTDLPFLLVTTGVERLSGSVHGPMAQRWLSDEPGVRSMVSEIASLAIPASEALVAGRLQELAEAMNANQRLIRELGGSGDAIDALIDQCLRHGAMAAKLAGAGMGGTVIALAEDPAGLEERLRGEGYSIFLRPEIGPGVRFEALD